MSDRRIVERLREWPLSEKLALEAADRIEALEAALREIADLASHHGVSARAFIDIACAALAPRHWPQDAIDQEMIERTDDGWKLK